MILTKCSSVFFDTNVYINLLRSSEYERKIERFLQGSFLYTLNKIVLMELWAGVQSKIEENIVKLHERSLPLIGMSDDNFVAAGKIMRDMSAEYHLEPRLRRRLTWDILIALSAQENNALLITENDSDFRNIQKFISFEYCRVGD